MLQGIVRNDQNPCINYVDAVVLLDIPMVPCREGAGRTPGVWAVAGAARCWTLGVHGGEKGAGKGSPASCAFPGLCGTGDGELLPCTAVSTAELREALGAEGCEMQPRPAGSSE